MDIQQDEIKVTLSRPIQYHRKGNASAEADVVTLRAPTLRQRKHLAKVKSAVGSIILAQQTRAQKSGAPEKAEAPEPDEKRFGHDVVMMMALMADDPDTITMFEDGMLGVLVDGGCWLDLETKATMPMLESLSMDDSSRIFGAYLSAFILPSMLSAPTA